MNDWFLPGNVGEIDKITLFSVFFLYVWYFYNKKMYIFIDILEF